MKNRIFLISVFASVLLFSCKKDAETNDEIVPQIEVPVSGHYVWTFEIPLLGTQESHLVFYTDSVGYVMTGSAFSTNYMMYQESYTETDEEKRWIGVGKGGSISKDGKYFVIFLKDITENTVTIYKHECESKSEAENFPYPEVNATADHGWNVYEK